jgi:hypothetical protein
VAAISAEFSADADASTNEKTHPYVACQRCDEKNESKQKHADHEQQQNNNDARGVGVAQGGDERGAPLSAPWDQEL